MKKCLVVTTVLALVAVLAAGCVGVPTPTSPTPTEEEVNFRLWISDEVNAIGDFDELWMTIGGIGVVQGDGDVRRCVCCGVILSQCNNKI